MVACSTSTRLGLCNLEQVPFFLSDQPSRSAFKFFRKAHDRGGLRATVPVDDSYATGIRDPIRWWTVGTSPLNNRSCLLPSHHRFKFFVSRLPSVFYRLALWPPFG